MTRPTAKEWQEAHSDILDVSVKLQGIYTMQESEDTRWLEVRGHIGDPPLMILSKDRATRLGRILTHWAKTGELVDNGMRRTFLTPLGFWNLGPWRDL